MICMLQLLGAFGELAQHALQVAFLKVSREALFDPEWASQ